MIILTPEKWIERVNPDDPPGDIAVRVLRNRLRAVLQFLPLAARKRDVESESVHQLRVWTRRTEAALKLFEEFIPRRRYEWMRQKLKRIRKAANQARDCDVLMQRLQENPPEVGAKRWLKLVRSERCRAQRVIVVINRPRRNLNRFSKWISKIIKKQKLLAEEQARRATPGFGDWARLRLRILVRDYFERVPSVRTDHVALHQFRIKGKELRYAMEILGSAFPASFRRDLYPIIESIQDRLGDINDHATAMSWLKKKLDHSSDEKEASIWAQLLECERVKFDQNRDEFWTWCTSERLQELRDGFEEVQAVPARSKC